MSPWVKITLLSAALSAGGIANAQDALDQTDPSQEEEQGDELAPKQRSSKIQFEQALATPAMPTDQASIDVGAVIIDGLVALDRSDFAEVIEQYMGRTLSPVELVELTQSIADFARARGYVFANAWIPPQDLVAGTLRVQVDEGVINEIRIVGSHDPAIRSMLEPLLTGQPISIAALERQVLLADDLPGVVLRKTSFERDGNKGVLLVEAYRQDWSGRASLATDGTRPVGPVRARIDVDANGLFLDSDGLDVRIAVVPFEIEELVSVQARYNVVVNDAGTDISLFGSYSNSEPAAYLANDDILGEAWRAGIRIRHPLMRRRDRGVWIEGSFEVQDLRQDRFGFLVRHDRVSVARIGAYGFLNGPAGALRTRLVLSKGLDVFDATQQGDPLASRFDGEPDFMTFNWWLNYRKQLGSGFSLDLNALAQLATAPLLIGEDIGLGGNYYIRGYDFSTRTGDQGIIGVGELRYDWPQAFGLVDNMQLYAFADGGIVDNLEGGFGGGSLASSGAGFRTDLTRTLDLDFEVAVPLSGPRYDTDNKAPRLNLRVSKSF